MGFLGSGSRNARLKNPIKKLSEKANIRNTFLNQGSPQHREVGVSGHHGQTDRHGDSMTVKILKCEYY